MVMNTQQYGHTRRQSGAIQIEKGVPRPPAPQGGAPVQPRPCQHPAVRGLIAKVRARRIQFQRAGGTLADLRDFMPDKYWQLRHCEWMLAGAIECEAWEEAPIHAGGMMWTWENALRDLHKVRSPCWLEIHRANSRRMIEDVGTWDATNWPGENVEAPLEPMLATA
jgi:hypothetical protein